MIVNYVMLIRCDRGYGKFAAGDVVVMRGIKFLSLKLIAQSKISLLCFICFISDDRAGHHYNA